MLWWGCVLYLCVIAGLSQALLPNPIIADPLDGSKTAEFVGQYTPEKAGSTPANGELVLQHLDPFQIAVEMQVPNLSGFNAVFQKWTFSWKRDGQQIVGIFPDCRVPVGQSVETFDACRTDVNENDERPFVPTLLATSTVTYIVTAQYTALVTRPGQSSVIETSPSTTSSITVTVSDDIFINDVWLPQSTAFVFADSQPDYLVVGGTMTWDTSSILAATADIRFLDQTANLVYNVQICTTTSCTFVNSFSVFRTSGYRSSMAITGPFDLNVIPYINFELTLHYLSPSDPIHDTTGGLSVLVPITDFQEPPGVLVTTLVITSFVDQDLNFGEIAGPFRFNRLVDDSEPDIIGYKLYLASDGSVDTRQSDPIATIFSRDLSGSTAEFVIPENTSVEDATIFQVTTFNFGGDSIFNANLLLADLAPPQQPATNAHFFDEDPRQGFIVGSVTFDRSAEDILALTYKLYWASASSSASRIGSSISTLTIGALPDLSVTRLSLGIPTLPVLARFFHVVLVNQFGESSFAAVLDVEDRGVPGQEPSRQFVVAPSFTDSNVLIDALSGGIAFTSTFDSVTGWAVYMAASTSVLSRDARPIATTLQSNATLTQGTQLSYVLFLSDYEIVNFRSLAHIVPFNSVGESSFFATLSLVDRAVPTGVVSSLTATDGDKDFKEIELTISFSRTNPAESFFRPTIHGYMVFLGRPSPIDPTKVVYQTEALATMSVEELDQQGLGLSRYVVQLPPVSYGSQDFNVLTVRAYNDDFNTEGRVFAELGPVISIPDSAVPPESFKAIQFTFTDEEELRDRIRGVIQFSSLCPILVPIISWNLYINDGSVGNLETGELNTNQVIISGAEADGGTIGSLVARIPQPVIVSSCATQTLSISIPGDSGTGDLAELVEIATNSIKLESERPYFMLLPVNGDGESRYATFLTIEDRASPDGVPRGFVFVDTNMESGGIVGSGTITRALDESFVDSYLVFIVEGQSRQARESTGVLIAEVPVATTQASTFLPFSVPNLNVTAGYYFHCVTHNEFGNSNALVVLVEDRDLPKSVALNFAHEDKDLDEDEISGTFSLSGYPGTDFSSNDPTQGYRLYVASGTTLATRGGEVAFFRICGDRRTATCSGNYVTQMPLNFGISGATHFHIVSVGVYGEGAFTTAVLNDEVGLDDGLQDTVAAAAVTAAVVAAASSAAAGSAAGGVLAAAAQMSGGKGGRKEREKNLQMQVEYRKKIHIKAKKRIKEPLAIPSPWALVAAFQVSGANSQTNADFPPEYEGYSSSMQWSNGEMSFMSFARIEGPSYTIEELISRGAHVISDGKTPEAYFVQTTAIFVLVVIADLSVMFLYSCYANRKSKQKLAKLAEAKFDTNVLMDEKAKMQKLQRKRQRKIDRLEAEERKREKTGKKPKAKRGTAMGDLLNKPKRWIMASILVRFMAVLYYAIVVASLFQVTGGKSPGLRAVALFFLIIVGLGMPFANIIVLSSRDRARGEYLEKEISKREKFWRKLSTIFAPILDDFDNSRKWFHVVIIARKLAMAVLVVILVNYGIAQVYMLIIVNVVYVLLVMRYDPYPGHWDFTSKFEVLMTILNIYALSLAAFVPFDVLVANTWIGMSLVILQLLSIVLFMLFTFAAVKGLVDRLVRARELKARANMRAKKKQQLANKFDVWEDEEIGGESSLASPPGSSPKSREVASHDLEDGPPLTAEPAIRNTRHSRMPRTYTRNPTGVEDIEPEIGFATRVHLRDLKS